MTGPLRIEVPCDRQGSFEPVLIPKRARRLTGFDDKIVASYARCMTFREVKGSLLKLAFQSSGGAPAASG